MKYVFLILHYMVIDETIGCIEGLLKNYGAEEIKIVIVDNKSPNNSGEILKKRYKGSNVVDVLINKKNDGFAKGNNYGYDYIKRRYKPSFLIAMNNDVVIEDKCFLSKVNRIYDREKFYVLGPDIFSTAFMVHQSPKRLSHYSLEELNSLKTRYKNQLEKEWIIRVKCLLKRSFFLRKKKYQKERNRIDWRKSYENVPLHGACLIFSREYIKKMDNLFYPNTFFYFEAEILDYICATDGMKTCYSPEITVIHHQNVSTNSAYNDIFKKTIFAIKCNLESVEEFYKLVKQKT